MAFILKPETVEKYILATVESKVIGSRSVTYSLTGSIGGFSKPIHAIFDPDLDTNRFFVSQDLGAGIKIINATTFATISTIPAHTSVVGMARDPDPLVTKIYCCLNDGLYVLDTATLSLTRVVVGSLFRFVTVDPDLTRDRILYTCAGRVYVIKRSDFSPIADYLLAPGTEVTASEGIAFDPIAANNRFLLVNRNAQTCKLINGVDFSTIRQTTAFSGVPVHILFDELDQFASFLICDINGGNFVRSIQTLTFQTINTITGFNTPVTISIDPRLERGRYLVCNYNGNTISILTRTDS